MLEKLRIGVRFLLALSVMALLVLAVAISGHLGLTHVQNTIQIVLLRDAHLAEEALHARAASLQLRRYEKDYFLNMGFPEKQSEYMVKWEKSRADLLQHLAELDAQVFSAADHETLRKMHADLDVYLAGFATVSAAVRNGELATPQAANILITQYKDAIRRFETTAGALGGSSDYRMRERVRLLQADARNTSVQMATTALLAIVVALLLGLQLSRTITVPMRSVVSAAQRLAAGDLSSPVAVTARDEVGDLQKAMLAISQRMAQSNGQAGFSAGTSPRH